ncbi:zinc-dependent metalloprotease [Pedobacter sp. MC2016-05]|uniref:zinc-dependent metalloprotease n=1 Tax=Pedobacter sp. MC2016-05 TaxID=2994474 RepID=UPI00224587C1|nr:zinc-dependent metalloprotease [Pedobacter sp. MC2016-05]MCX2475364.1 zinc-dependent metalloprotease [Pedobacter sp. MC2016-05]
MKIKSFNVKLKPIGLRLIILCLIFGVSSCSLLKSKKVKPTITAPATSLPPKAKADSLKNGLKPYKEVITSKAVSQYGLMNVHKVAERYYFEVPKKIIKRDILVVSRLSGSTPGAGSFAGEEIGRRMVYWEQGPENKLFLKVSALVNVADSTDMIAKAVTNSNINPITASFPIKALAKDSSAFIIDVTEFLMSENPLLAFNGDSKKSFGLNTLAIDRSFIKAVKTFPTNTEIRTVRTYNSLAGTLPGTALAGAVTIELNNSFLLLPEVPMRKRYNDPRVGYFVNSYTKYGDEQQAVKSESFVNRWRLEVKDGDLEKYKKGELVEPKKQIVYYIDPATPKKWRPYLIAGINDWQKAFEDAGFKNAIIGKEWPESDSTMSLEDSRYSVLRYFASANANAYGPNVSDPRSGEILESHIGWYHNVMTLVHNWYMIQCGAVDPRARKNVFDDKLMGQLIRFVSSHEIGHTLGLRHNMGASSTVPVEKLRDKAWVEKHGHTPSIMDYARFNYVAQPEDGISESGLFPRINDYDKWAIKWGYQVFPDTRDALEEKKILNTATRDSLSKNNRLWFSGEGRDYDPRSQSEDLGDDAVKASLYGIKNLKRIVPNLIAWTSEEGTDYSQLNTMYRAAVGQLNTYAVHVLKSMGGVMVNTKLSDQSGAVYTPVSLKKQKEAIKFFNEQIFMTPKWLLDKKIMSRIDPGYSGNSVQRIQQDIVAAVTAQSRLYRMIVNQRDNGKGAYSPSQWLNDLKKGIFSEVYSGASADEYRRALQKMYVGSIITMFNKRFALQGSVDNIIAALTPTDVLLYSNVKALAYAHLRDLRNDISQGIPMTKDRDTKIHLQYLKHMLDKIIDESPIPGLNY